MADFYSKADIFAWMPLTGFDKNLPDKGVDVLMERAGFTPTGVCLFLFHSDLVHHHDGLREEKILPPDICSYYANPYNEERSRQEWTNFELRDLVLRLREKESECFLSIMQTSLNNLFHEEWIYEHPELCIKSGTSTRTLLVLKRFRNGTYYEDFFIEKLCEVMEDYGFSGLHVTDRFCPASGVVYDSDFSMDMVEQFTAYTGLRLPDELTEGMDDSQRAIRRRRDYVWEHLRREWITFLTRRWEAFFKKLCDRLHAIGRKVFVLGMYCTDPFDTMYCLGVDVRRLVNAGVDYLMPNMAANSSSIGQNRPWPYHRWASMIPLTDACAPAAKKICMLAVKDASEEWDIIHHAPTLLDRDVSYLAAYLRYQKDGSLRRCVDGYNVCLADGVGEAEWVWLRERFDIGFGSLPKRSLAPTFLWSDTVHEKILGEYIQNRRWTPHKFLYEMNLAGAHMGAYVRAEDLTDECGDLFVTHFDLLSEEEKRRIASYTGGGVICVSSAALDPAAYGICPELMFTDKDTPYPHTAFVFGFGITDTEAEAFLSVASEKDDTPPLDDPFHAAESPYTLTGVMPYQKVSGGFLKALALLARRPFAHLFSCTHPVLPMEMEDGAIRLYILNDDRLHYAKTVVTAKGEIEAVKNVSKFPLLPVKFSEDGMFNFASPHEPCGKRCFRVIVPQGGLGIVDLYLKK